MLRSKFLPSFEERQRARNTPRAFWVLGPDGLRWHLRPVYAPPRLNREPPTVRRFDSERVARAMLTDLARADLRRDWLRWAGVRRG